VDDVKALHLHVTWPEFEKLVEPTRGNGVNLRPEVLRSVASAEDVLRVEAQDATGRWTRVVPHARLEGPRLTEEEAP
jgi:hypothetical protein